MDNNSLAHTKWNCKYHVVFVDIAYYPAQIISIQVRLHRIWGRQTREMRKSGSPSS